MISRGQIYFVNLSPTQGREHAGHGPVLVVSSDAINRQPLVTVAVGTDAANVPREYPTNIRVTARKTGLSKETVFLCFQLRSLDPARFLDPRTKRRCSRERCPPRVCLTWMKPCVLFWHPSLGHSSDHAAS
jgi:mRNA interferase MazF